MPKTQTKNPHPIIKILSDLNLLPEKGEDVDAKSYKRAVRTAIVTIESSSKDKAGDSRSRMLRDELKRIKELEREKKEVEPPKQEVNIKEKKTTIKPAKLLPGTATTKPDDLKQAQIDESGEDKSKLLQPDILNDIAKSVESIATLLKRQLGVEKKQQRDVRIKQDKDNKAAREDKLETKPDKKTGLIPKAISAPTLGFFERIKKFFLNIVIGAGALKLFNWLKDPANAEKITQFKDFLVNNAGWILGGLATIALLPIALSLVAVVKGILAGLALLGPLLPLLPWILGGLLLGAVAWWISKKLFGEREYTGRERTWIERKENKERLRKAGILTATEKRLEIIDDETGKKMLVPMFGDNSITGREAIAERRENKNQRVTLNLLDSDHQAWYVKNYGQEALDAKLAAHKSFRDTKAALKQTAKDMEKEINEVKEKYKKLSDANDSLGWKERRKANAKLGKQMNAEIKAIREKAGQQAIQIGDNVTGDNVTEATEIKIDNKSDASTEKTAIIDKEIKPNTEVPGPSTKNNKGNVVVAGGEGGNQQQSSGGGGGGGSSSVPKIGSEDLNNLSTIATSTTYNMVGV